MAEWYLFIANSQYAEIYQIASRSLWAAALFLLFVRRADRLAFAGSAHLLLVIVWSAAIAVGVEIPRSHLNAVRLVTLSFVMYYSIKEISRSDYLKFNGSLAVVVVIVAFVLVACGYILSAAAQ